LPKASSPKIFSLKAASMIKWHRGGSKCWDPC
jgi:hypothetical protein